MTCFLRVLSFRGASGKYFLKIPLESHGLKRPNNRNALSFKKAVDG